MANKFDIHGPRPLRERLSKSIKRAYLWPQSAFVHPVDTKDTLPIFIVGCGNSGTSMLAAALGRSDELLLMGYESGAFFPEKGYFAAREAALAWLSMTRQTGHKGFVEKTPKHVHCIGRILKVVPDARIIAITRDGRDVMASFKERGLSPQFAIERWCIDNTAILRERDEGRVIMTRYEDLVQTPEQELVRLSGALGISFEDKMIHGTGSAYSWIEGKTMGKRAEQTARPIYDNRNKWKTKLTAADISAFWSNARPVMTRLGYEA